MLALFESVTNSRFFWITYTVHALNNDWRTYGSVAGPW